MAVEGFKHWAVRLLIYRTASFILARVCDGRVHEKASSPHDRLAAVCASRYVK